MGRGLIAAGAVLAFLAVGTGAFGAHALKDRLGPELLAIWKTAVEYHLAHAIGTVLIGLFAVSRPSGLAHAAGWALVFGITVFSGSLYLLALTGKGWLGAITPIGGIGFMVGWVLLAIAALKRD